MKIRLSGVVEESIVDGPGFRYVIFTQGCPHNCEGCHNPQTHDPAGGYEEDTDKLFSDIVKDPLLDGVTFSGGEPFCQCPPLAALAGKLRAAFGDKLSIMSYSGFTYEQLMKMAEKDEDCRALLGSLDYLVDGKFEIAKRSLELKFRGSSNQRFIDMKKSFAEGRPVEADTEFL